MRKIVPFLLFACACSGDDTISPVPKADAAADGTTMDAPSGDAPHDAPPSDGGGGGEAGDGGSEAGDAGTE